MYDFEKLGAFYLGKRADAGSDQITDELVLYDSKDLTTHAVIIGMTGSGKTGLGIGLIEEAALDHVPVIAIDPKGDMGNLLLTFPDLEPSNFRPWINERQASDRDMSPEEFAAEQAAQWKKGLADWGQDGARIAKLRESTDMAIYTPGSNAGRQLSLLQSFAAPAAALTEDVDLYRERIQSTATGLLSLVDIDADPLTSREHILLSQIFDHAWAEGRDLDLAGLIGAIQDPPMDRVGVMSLDSFFPAKERFELAMRLNNLLAAPGFEAWMRGEELDAAKLFYTESGKPRISILSIAHLSDAERMFFVSMLLNELIAWMRAQQGTSALRAILYMDELAGYMPPVANPPSKQLFLTLLKQARAYGLGLVLATQNPVDLDYKGLSNTGTWFIGRLQTERDGRWEKQFKRWVRLNETISLLKSARFRMTSEPGESEGEFRARLQQKASEERDAAIAKIRKRYATKATTLENRLLRAEQAIARESDQASSKTLSTVVSFGTAILGAVLGRKRLSATTASRIGTAIRGVGGARQQSADVDRAKEKAEKVRADIEELNTALEAEIDALDTAYDAQSEELTEVLIKAKVADVHVPVFGLVWMPCRDAGDGRLEPVPQ